MIVTCRECESTFDTSDAAAKTFSILYYDDRKEYICWPCCRKYAEINDAKGG